MKTGSMLCSFLRTLHLALQFTEHPQVCFLLIYDIAHELAGQRQSSPLTNEETEATGGMVPARPRPHWPD